MKKAPKKYANGTPTTGTPNLTALQQQALQREKDLSRTVKERAMTGNKAYFQGGERVKPDPVTGDYADYVMKSPGLYESKLMIQAGPNDLMAPGATQAKKQAVEVVDPKTGQKNIITLNTAQYKPDAQKSIIDPMKNTLPPMIQTAGQTDAEALKNYKVENPQLQLKKGGLVSKLKMGGKVKGYEDGGQTEDNSKEVAAAIGMAAPYVAEGANMAILNKNNVDEYGRIDTGSKAGDYSAGIGSGALGGAAKGASAGAALGPYGVAIGSVLGAITGGVKGGIETKKDRASIEADKKAEEEAKRQLEVDRQKAVFDRSLNKELMGRKTGYGYKKGGLVGKFAMGGPVSDAPIDSLRYQEETPYSALNDMSRKEKRMAKSYGLDPSKMTIAQSQQINKIDANTPKTDWLGRTDIAGTNAQTTMFGGTRYKDKGMGGGGFSVPMPTAMFAKGGYVKGPGTGTSDSVKAKIEPGSFIVPAKNAPVAEKIHKMMEGGEMKKKMAPKKKVASLNEEDGEEVRLSDGEYKFTPEQRKEIITDLGEDVLEALAPEAEEYSDGYKYGTKKGGTKKKTSDPFAGTGVDDKKKEPYSATGSDIESKQSSQGSSDKLGSGKKSPPKKKVVAESMTMKDVQLPTTNTETVDLKKTVDSPIVGESDLASKNKRGLSAQQLTQLGGDLLQTASAGANFMLPRRQVRMGTEFLAKTGARPVDQISPEFQDAYNKAQQEARYGFSPEEQALIKNQNLNALKQQREAARFYGLGYAGERQAINESFGRGLSAAVANKERMLQKQMEANQLGLQKADMSRRLFNDQMNAWQQNQQSGAELVNAGLTNQINAKRYADVLMNLQKNKAVESSWLNNLNLGQ